MNPSSLLAVCAVVLALALSGCATEYQARGFFGDGYSEMRIDANTYRVNFECNEVTSEGVCDGYLFRRCAELTLNAGYDFFVMVDHYSTVRENQTVVPGHYDKVVTRKGNEERTSYVFKPGYTSVTRSPVSTALIKMYRGMKPVDDTRNAFDAREILRYAAPTR